MQKAALPQLSETALLKMASEAGVPLDTLLYRMSDATRLNVLNLGQLKVLLKSFRDFLQGTPEKVLLTGNKSALIERVIHLSQRTIPPGLFQAHHRPAAPTQRLNNAELPPAVREAARFVPPVSAVVVPVQASRSFEGSGVSEASFRIFQAPTWQVEEVLGVGSVRYQYQPPSEVRCSFEWSDETKRRVLRDPKVRVHLRVVLLDGKDVRFRSESSLMVNYELVSIPLLGGPRKNLVEPHFAPPGLDVTPMFSRASNNVMVTFNNVMQWTGVCVATLVSPIPLEALSACVPYAPPEIEARYSRSRDAGTSAGDLTEVSFTVSLDDPLGLERIRVPVMGQRCRHFQCFDLDTFLEFCSQRSTWNCPVCSAPTPQSSLFRLRSFMTVLEQFPDAKLVVCNPDGTFQEHEAETQGKYERSIEQKRKIVKTSGTKRESVHVIGEASPSKRTNNEPQKANSPPPLLPIPTLPFSVPLDPKFPSPGGWTFNVGAVQYAPPAIPAPAIPAPVIPAPVISTPVISTPIISAPAIPVPAPAPVPVPAPPSQSGNMDDPIEL